MFENLQSELKFEKRFNLAYEMNTLVVKNNSGVNLAIIEETNFMF